MTYSEEETFTTKELWCTDKFSMASAKVPTSVQTGWSVTNNNTDRTIDANVAAEVGDGLATLILDLIAKGVISA